jgi:uncharacterized protein YvpB
MSEPWKRNLPVPYFSQRENKYLWQQIATEDITYKGKSVKEGEAFGDFVSLAWSSCNITSLCMILHYFGITDDTPDQMMEKFFTMIFPGENGGKDFRHEAYTEKLGPNRLIFGHLLKIFVTDAYDLNSNYILHTEKKLSIDDVQDYIAKGYPVWISYGPLGKIGSGHIAVIRGFTKDDDVILNDPWGDPANGIHIPADRSETLTRGTGCRRPKV